MEGLSIKSTSPTVQQFMYHSTTLLSLEHLENEKLFILSMDHHENRFNDGMIICFNVALDHIEKFGLKKPQDYKYYGLITKGKSNGKFYSNGLDLNQFFQKRSSSSSSTSSSSTSNPFNVTSEDRLRIFNELNLFLESKFLPLLSRILTFSIPTLAMINGHAYAGGLLLAMAHDYRIMQSQKGYLCMNEIMIGLSLHPGMTSLLSIKINNSSLLHASLLEGKKWNAEQALKDDLVVNISDPDGLFELGKNFIQTKTKLGHGGLTFQEIKENLYLDLVTKLKGRKKSFALSSTSKL